MELVWCLYPVLHNIVSGKPTWVQQCKQGGKCHLASSHSLIMLVNRLWSCAHFLRFKLLWTLWYFWVSRHNIALLTMYDNSQTCKSIHLSLVSLIFFSGNLQLISLQLDDVRAIQNYLGLQWISDTLRIEWKDKISCHFFSMDKMTVANKMREARFWSLITIFWCRKGFSWRSKANDRFVDQNNIGLIHYIPRWKGPIHMGTERNCESEPE